MFEHRQVFDLNDLQVEKIDFMLSIAVARKVHIVVSQLYFISGYSFLESKDVQKVAELAVELSHKEAS